MRSRHSVEGASCESEPERGRGTPLSCLRTRRTRCAAEFGRGLVVLIFIIVNCGYPYTIGTNTKLALSSTSSKNSYKFLF
jgi:hypothetical protein